MFRVVTVGREYGSGGAAIARMLASRLGWNLLDRTLIEKIAETAKVEPELAERYDERVDPWFHRLSRRALWHGAFEGVAPVSETEVFDAETTAILAGRIIEEAARIGNCVIVGRGAQCVLRDRPDTLRVFVYAPRPERIQRVRKRVGADADMDAVMDTVDRERAAYIRLHFQQEWLNPHLYHLMISSELGEERVLSAILSAMATGQRKD